MIFFKEISRIFIQKLRLPAAATVVVKTQGVVNEKQVNIFDSVSDGYPWLLLFHGIRECNTVRRNEIIKNIKQQSLVAGSSGNKGYGIYMSNYSRYQYSWLGTDFPVIASLVAADPNRVTRYRAEFANSCSEFVIRDPRIILPIALINYKVSGVTREDVYGPNVPTAYVKYGNFGCAKCDAARIRCDCPQHPLVLPEDVFG